jgi:hypothetical protein
MLQKLLEQLIPEELAANPRVAMRPAAAALAIVVGAIIVAFGIDTIAIVGSWLSKWTRFDLQDLPLTTTTISVLLAVLLLVISFLLYRFRYHIVLALCRFWFERWKPQLPVDIDTIGLLRQMETVLADLDTARQQAETREANEVSKLEADLSRLSVTPQSETGPARAERQKQIDAKSTELKALDRNSTTYQAASQEQSVEMNKAADTLLHQLKLLLTYLLTNEASLASKAEGQGAQQNKKDMPPIDTMLVRWVGANVCRTTLADLEQLLAKAHPGAIEEFDRSIEPHRITLQEVSGRVRTLVQDVAFLPSSRENVDFKPRTWLGYALERTSLGKGRGHSQVPRDYYVDASHQDAGAGTLYSDPSVLSPEELKNNVDLRNEVFSAVNSALMAALLAVFLGVFGAISFRPGSIMLFLFPVAAVFFVWRAIEHVRSACNNGIALAAYESQLWQRVIYPDSRPRGLLVSHIRQHQFDWERIGWPVTAAVLLLGLNVLLINQGGFGRYYRVAHAAPDLLRALEVSSKEFRLTDFNVDTAIKWETKFRESPPTVRLTKQLLGTTIAGHCAADAVEIEGPTLLYDPNKAPEETRDNCRLASYWKPSVTSGGAGPTLEVDYPEIRYRAGSEPPKLHSIEVGRPDIRYDDNADPIQLPPLSAVPPSVDAWESDEPLEVPPLTLQQPIVKPWESDEPLVLPPLTLQQPAVKPWESDKPLEVPPLTLQQPTVKPWESDKPLEVPPLTLQQPTVKPWESDKPLEVPPIALQKPNVTAWEPDEPLTAPALALQKPTVTWTPDALLAVPDLSMTTASGESTAPIPSPPTWQPSMTIEGVHLWFRPNCPQISEPAKRQINVNASRRCQDKDEGLNRTLNDYFHTSPESVVAFVREKLANLGDTDGRIFIVGHADVPGASEYNDLLSKERVDYVAQLLISKANVRPDQMEIHVASGRSPWIPQESATESQALNRRVDVYIR